MKRFHVNLSVADIQQSVQFYNKLFAQEPSLLKTDYAKWMLDDPRINFSITSHGTEKGVDHLGFESDDSAEFEAVRERLHQADLSTFEQPDVTCCYARSSKSWVRDPDDVAWETFVSHGQNDIYDNDSGETSLRNARVESETGGYCTSATNENSCCN